MIEETRYKETPSDIDRSRIAVAPAPVVATTTVTPADYDRPFGAISAIAWGPIWAGVVVALGVQVLLAVLGTAIGLSWAQATTTGEGFGVAAGIWWVISGLASLFIGGWVAGYLSNLKKPAHGALHGFVLWCVVTVLSLVLVATAGGALIGGGMAALNQPDRTGDRVQQPANQATTQDMNRMQQPPQQQLAETGAGVAWWTFIMLALGAGAAAVGGSVGTNKPRTTNRHRTT